MYKSSNHNCAWILQYNRVIIGELVDNKKMGYALFIFDLIQHDVSFFGYYMMCLSKEIITFFNCFTLFLSLVVYIMYIVLFHSILRKTIPQPADILTVVNVFTF